jgi:hypothetical protein
LVSFLSPSLRSSGRAETGGRRVDRIDRSSCVPLYRGRTERRIIQMDDAAQGVASGKGNPLSLEAKHAS